ncbi:hypothetical protein B5X24_HaOG216555 [Helicoverpa armigera]|uniref:Uncharacterized protein n=1 Tax=Helicoverpa armigera TaxID=29058 RepID=A0A2W1CXR0_HELAM|nr:hypothetical protein B5X24_HaOG216555 [Helicoverpa armigera]
MKADFTEKLNKLVSRKKSNSFYFMNTSRYQDLINEVKETKNKWNKNFEDYKILANYDILNICDRERLIKPRDEVNTNIKFYVYMEELFGVLHTIHLLFKHANLDVMDSELKTKYCNVSKEVIKLYLSCCKICKEKNFK